MKIAIIGAGFTGLSAAYRLAKSGHAVTVFERDPNPGGLAVGFKDKKWDWALEKHYHHLFTSDWSIRNLAKEIGHPIDFIRPKTSTLVGGQIHQLDSAMSLLHFSKLSVVDRLRTAIGLAILKFNPFWQPFEYTTAKKFILVIMGQESWQVLWEPLFKGKFGQFTDQISASWFWARIYKRSSSLGYPKGGFLALAFSIEKAARKYKAKFNYNVSVDSIDSLTSKFDRVICTLPTPMFSKISGLSYPGLQGIGAVNLVLALKHTFFSDQTYWLNINEPGFPFLAVVEHTNFIAAKRYAGDHLLYVGNYLPATHPYFAMNDKDLLKIFLPYLKRINPKFQAKWIRASWVWKAPFAQPIVTPRYSKSIPPLTTGIPNVYLANIQQVYPYDRGTNYAVQLGEQVALLCTTKSNHS